MRSLKPSPAMLVALLALFVALGGSSYAALNLPKGSVGPKQLKKNAVTSTKVKPGSLELSDFNASQRSQLRGPQGEQGPQGAQGPQGSQGPAGAPATTLWAFVAANGTLLRSSSPGFSVLGAGFGSTTVQFPVDVSACSFAVTIAGLSGDTYYPRGEVKVFHPQPSTPRQVIVSMTADGDGSGTAADQRSIYIQAFC